MIGIVGAGLSGLALGMELRARGVEYRTFEATGEPGGVVRTRTVDGRRLDLGPQRLRLSPELSGALTHLPAWEWERPGDSGSDDADRVFIARSGELHRVPRTLREALSTRVVSPWGKLRIALEPFSGSPDPKTASSAASYLRDRVGDEGYRALIGPLFGGLYGSDPESMEASRNLLPALREIGADRSLLRFILRSRAGTGGGENLPRVPRGGMQALAHALMRVQDGAVSLDTPVLRVGKRAGDGYLIGTDEEEVAVSSVVITAPPRPAAELLGSLSADASAALRKLTVNPILLVHLALDPLPPGLGFQVAFGEEGRVKGVTFSGNLDGSGSTAVAFMGGMQDPAAMALSDAAAMEIAAEETRRWTGSQVTPIHVSRTAMPAWDRSWQALDGLRLPAGIHLLTNYTGRPGIIGRFREAARLSTVLIR